MNAHSFSGYECVDGNYVVRDEVEWVVLHTRLFFGINVIFDRRILVYDGR